MEESLLSILAEGEARLLGALGRTGPGERRRAVLERDLDRLRALARSCARAELAWLAAEGRGGLPEALVALGCRRLSEVPVGAYPALVRRMEDKDAD